MSLTEEANDVLFSTKNNAGIILLNRPKSLNALNNSMIIQMRRKLGEWEKQKNLVIIKGANKIFCAGGDLKIVLENTHKGKKLDTFVIHEYNLNHLTGNYKIPYVAIIDGIAMGGGLGVSVHGPYRVATENSSTAMPETKIGLVPDVGGSYFLPRLPYHIGYFLGLTSHIVSGKEVVAVGIATHFVSSKRLPELENALSNCVTDEDVKITLNKFNEPIGDKFSLTPHLKDIDHCFSAPTVEEIIQRLTLVDNKWSAEVIKSLRERCPLTLKTALKAMKLGANMNLWQVLQMEYRVCARAALHHNFREGVRAQLVDKDKNPQWIPKTLEEVNESDVNNFFEPLPQGELILLNANSKL